MNSWIYLLFAILFEVMGTVNLKLSQGFTRLWPSIFIFIYHGISMGFQTLAMKEIDLTIVYALWSAVGIAAIAVIGVVAFHETMMVVKAVSLVFIVVGIIGLVQ